MEDQTVEKFLEKLLKDHTEFSSTLLILKTAKSYGETVSDKVIRELEADIEYIAKQIQQTESKVQVTSKPKSSEIIKTEEEFMDYAGEYDHDEYLRYKRIQAMKRAKSKFHNKDGFYERYNNYYRDNEFYDKYQDYYGYDEDDDYFQYYRNSKRIDSNISEKKLSDISENKLSDISEKKLSDISENKLSDISENKLSDISQSSISQSDISQSDISQSDISQSSISEKRSSDENVWRIDEDGNFVIDVPDRDSDELPPKMIFENGITHLKF